MSKTEIITEIVNYLTAIGIDSTLANTIARELITASDNKRPLFELPGRGKTLTPAQARELGVKLTNDTV